ncbi:MULTISPECIES: RDD family protein [unclassified Isoptericola]|uniref:RDD family protein n=1 Tax=unclassified Isoptericola TaxID=2623355 RepID=UPI003652F821
MTSTVRAGSPPPGAFPPPAAFPPLNDDLGPFTDDRPRAPWGLRVLATLLDSALVAFVAFLGTGDSPPFGTLPAVGPSGDPVDETTTLWVAGTLLVLGVLQAYTGMTPGKRVAGISVVDDRSGRPIGLPGTIVRWFAHVLDAILLIGYVRAAFHREGRTFADSLLGTVAVRSTTPEPHPLVARLRAARDAHAPWLRWPRRVTGAVALVVCAAAAAASVMTGSGGGEQMSEHETSCASTGPSAATAVFGSARTVHEVSRLGITRTTTTTWRVAVGWSAGLGLDGADNPAVDATTVRLSVSTPGGPTYDSLDAVDGDPDGYPEGAETDDAGDGLWWSLPDLVASTELTASQDVTGWTAHTALVADDGTVLAECSAPVPALDTEPEDL